MRYYEQEHVDGYARITSQGLEQWSDLHEHLDGFHHFPNRAFLDRALPPIAADERLTVLEYGCGTGPAACFLAARGYSVRGVDLVPAAIEMARQHAAELGVDVDFGVEDVCRWADEAAELYDVVVDSFCLQSIVLDADRSRVLQGVRRRLGPGGRYVLSTSVFDPARTYGNDHIDHDTGIVWTPTSGPVDDAIRLGGSWYLPHRRHRTADALREELVRSGFVLLEQSAEGGDLVCCAAT